MKQRRFDLLTIDKSWVDVLLKVPHLPQHDQKMLGEPLGRSPGGTGGNVACTASRLGLHVGMISWVGDDPDGQLVIDDLRDYGVDTTYITCDASIDTNYTTILLDPSGEKSIIIVPTSFDTLDISPDLRAYLTDSQLVYSTAYDLDQLERVARAVRPHGGRVCTDIEQVAAVAADKLDYALSLVDIAFLKFDILNTDDYEATIRELQQTGPAIIIITFGAEGAMLCEGGEVSFVPAFPVPVTDTTGAGDCFIGAFLAAYARGCPAPEAVRYANAAAALSIQAQGARGALPTPAQVEDFLHSHQT